MADTVLKFIGYAQLRAGSHVVDLMWLGLHRFPNQAQLFSENQE